MNPQTCSQDELQNLISKRSDQLRQVQAECDARYRQAREDAIRCLKRMNHRQPSPVKRFFSSLPALLQVLWVTETVLLLLCLIALTALLITPPLVILWNLFLALVRLGGAR